ncbi:MAG: type II toxin-antitoxin system RelE/ParE family toxin [Deltaproteobacteria bacterium]|nr:type II toxin-antitoxin system RelE/ParE family toxin [Deltaproteobacteria bacterium]
MSATTYRVVLHRDAVAEVRKLPNKTRERVKQAIDALAVDPRPAASTKLKGRPNAYRIRFGNYGLLYEVHATEVVVYVVGVAHRREVYRRLLRRR